MTIIIDNSQGGSTRMAEMPASRKRAIIRSYPVYAQGVFKGLVAARETDEAFFAACHDQKQALRLKHSQLNAALRANARRLEHATPENKRALEDEDRDLREESAENQEAVAGIDFDIGIRRKSIDPAPVEAWMLRNSNRAKSFKTYEPAIPVQSVAKDEKALREVREKIDAYADLLRDVDLAPLPETAALEKTLAQIDQIAKGAAPDFSPTVRLAKHGFNDRRTQGSIKWPERYVGSDQFEPDGFRLLFWLFGDQIKERARAEIKKLSRPGALSLIEREEKKKELEAERFELWRIEEALVTRLRDAGRTDIDHRPETPVPVLLRLS